MTDTAVPVGLIQPRHVDRDVAVASRPHRRKHYGDWHRPRRRLTDVNVRHSRLRNSDYRHSLFHYYTRPTQIKCLLTDIATVECLMTAAAVSTQHTA